MLRRMALFCVFLFFIFIVIAFAEEALTITTYYPSPYGVYKTLRLYPNDDVAAGDACINPGEMSYDASANKMLFCDGSTNKWRQLGGGGAYVGATSGTYAPAGVGGYSGGDAKCAAAYAGSRVCVTADFVNGRPTSTGYYYTYVMNGHCRECEGWTMSDASDSTQIWNSASNMTQDIECNIVAVFPLLCCK